MTQRSPRPPARRAPGPQAPAGRAVKAAIRREQLLSTARDLFCARGYAATSTKSIAEAAGVTEGLVFHYFGSKEALLLELASRQSTFAGRVLSLVQGASHGTARDLLAAIAAGVADVSEQEASFIGFLSAEAQVNPLVRAPLVAGTRVVVGGLVEILRGRVTTGELRPDASLSAAVHGFFGGFAFFLGQHRDLGPAAWRRQAAEFSRAWADQCWRGIASLDSLRIDSMKPKRRSRR